MNHQLRKSLKIMAFQRWCQEPPAEVAAKAEISARWQACNWGRSRLAATVISVALDDRLCHRARCTETANLSLEDELGLRWPTSFIATALNVVCPGTWGLRCLPLPPAKPSSRCELPAPGPSDSRRRTREPPFRKRLRPESGPMPLNRYPSADRAVPWPARSGRAGVPPRLSDAHSEPGEPAPLRRRWQSRH